MSYIETPTMVDDESVSIAGATEDANDVTVSAKLLVPVMASAALTACGGGGSNGENDSVPDGSTLSGEGRSTAQSVTITSTSKPNQLDAWRFLNQATFGPTQQDINAVMSSGYVAWLNTQFNMTKSVSLYKLTETNYTTKIGPLWPDPDADDPEALKGYLHRTHVSSAWWEKALTSPDQLRVRVAFALSEILVIAMQGGSLAEFPYMCASYYDLLLDGAFGSFKDLVKKVAGHPAMGMYLSHLSNKKPDGNRIPDQNFAREIMQLFSIGLYQLNIDGSLQLDSAGKPVETYTPYDVEVMSHVFTGWGWQHAFEAWFRRLQNISSQTSQMKAYPEWHSTLNEFPKKDAAGKVVRYPNAASGTVTLLGKPLNISATSNPEADRQAALDILFAHQNVAPFIAKQMIQRLVTSNPSKAYVGRVAKAFKDSGLNIKSLVQAILLDTEARDVATVRNDPTYGKLREPILRVTQFMRAFSVKSVGGKFHVGSLQSVSGWPSDSLGQSPLESPSVFNFFRPGYVAPNTEMAKKGKVTPEMQINSETEVAAYVRFMEMVTFSGFGAWVKKDGNPVVYQVTPDSEISPVASVYPDFAQELAVSVDTTKTNAQRAAAVIDLFNVKLFGGAMSQSLKAHLTTLADRFGYDTDTSMWGAASLRIATFAAVATITPEYVVQR